MDNLSKILKTYYDSDLISKSKDIDVNCTAISIIYRQNSSFDLIVDKLLELNKLEKIEFISMGIEMKLNDSIGKLKHIKSLELSRFENIKVLPEGICELYNLEELKLNGCNHIEKLPENIGNLSNLKKLSIESIYENCLFENIKELPASICKLSNLESLYLNGLINIKELPENFGNLTSLKEIKLVKLNNLTNLPQKMWYLPNLENLQIDSIKKIKVIPEELGELTQLKILLLKSLIITKLPSSIGKLINLEKLEIISLTKLIQIPDELGKLKQLNYLGLENLTKIEKISPTINGLTSLKTLKIHILKELKSIPNELDKLELLEKLSITKCTNLENLTFINGVKDKLILGWIEETLSYLTVIPFKYKRFLRRSSDLLKLDILGCTNYELYQEINLCTNKALRLKCLIQFNEIVNNKKGEILIKNDSTLFINGKSLFSTTELKEKLGKYNIEIVNKILDADYVFIGDKGKLTFHDLEDKILIFQNNLENLFSENNEHYLKDSNGLDLDLLKELILAQDKKSCKIAIEMMKNGGIPLDIKSWLVIRYFLMESGNDKKNIGELLKLNFPDISKIGLFKKGLNNIEKIIINLKEIFSEVKDIDINSMIIEILENRQMDMMDFEKKLKIVENKTTLNIFHGTPSLKKTFSDELLCLTDYITELQLFNIKTTLLPENFYKFINLEKITVNFSGYGDIVGENPYCLSEKKLDNFSNFKYLKEIHLNYEDVSDYGRTQEAKKDHEKEIDKSRELANSVLKPLLVKGCKLIVNGKEV